MESILKSLRLSPTPTGCACCCCSNGKSCPWRSCRRSVAMGQSTISTHLSQLKQAGLVEDRRTGKNVHLPAQEGGGGADLVDCSRKRRARCREAEQDREALRLALEQAAGPGARLFRRTGGEVRPPLCAGPVLEGSGGDAAQADAADGDCRPWCGRRHVFAVTCAAGRARDRGRQLRKDGGLRSRSWRSGTVSTTWSTGTAISKTFPSKTAPWTWRSSASRCITRSIRRGRFEKPGGFSSREAGSPFSIWLNTILKKLANCTPTCGWVSAKWTFWSFWRRRASRGVEIAMVHREDQPPHLETLLAIGVKPAL